MVLGDSCFHWACLEKANKVNGPSLHEGLVYATEILEHNISISYRCCSVYHKVLENGFWGGIDPKEVDVNSIYMPRGTIKAICPK